MNSWVDKMRQSGRQVLTLKQTFFHYFFSFFIPITFGLLVFLYMKTSPSSFYKIGFDFFENGIKLTLFIGFAYAVRQYSSLEMKYVHFQGAEQDFDQIVNQLIVDNQWVIESKSPGLYVCTIPFKWTNWGTLITLVKTDDGVYYNSICDLYNRPSTTSFGMNLKNKRAIAKAFEAASNPSPSQA